MRVLSIIMVLVFMVVPVFGEQDIMKGPQEDKKTEDKHGFCPVTNIEGKVNDCMICHVMHNGKFRVKETDPDSWRDYPIYYMRVDGDKAYITIEDIEAGLLVRFLEYVRLHKIKHIVLELYSPGGSVAEAWRMISYLAQYEADGGIVETRVYGYAASAGFMMTVAGTTGHRYVGKHAMLMAHELIEFKWLSITTPSEKKDEAKILELWQDNINSFLASKSKLTPEEIHELIYKIDFWMTGEDAVVKYGFADHIIGE